MVTCLLDMYVKVVGIRGLNFAKPRFASLGVARYTLHFVPLSLRDVPSLARCFFTKNHIEKLVQKDSTTNSVRWRRYFPKGKDRRARRRCGERSVYLDTSIGCFAPNHPITLTSYPIHTLTAFSHLQANLPRIL